MENQPKFNKGAKVLVRCSGKPGIVVDVKSYPHLTEYRYAVDIDNLRTYWNESELVLNASGCALMEPERKFNIGSSIITGKGDRGTIVDIEPLLAIADVRLESTGLVQRWHVDRLKLADACATQSFEESMAEIETVIRIPRSEDGRKAFIEEQRLRNIVIEASRAWRRHSGLDRTVDGLRAHDEFWDAVDALEQHLNPITAEAPAPRCEPPACSNGQYWIENVDPDAEWDEGFGRVQVWDFNDGHWKSADGERFTPEEHHAGGWRYLEPAVYSPTTAPVSTTRLLELLMKKHNTLVWVTNSAEGKELTKLLAEHRARAMNGQGEKA